jgi:hypothetical protein
LIFANDVAAAVWKESWCDRCFQPDQVELRERGKGRGCPVLLWAMQCKTAPKELAANRRQGVLMKDSFRCSGFAAKPPSAERPAVVEQVEVLF